MRLNGTQTSSSASPSSTAPSGSGSSGSSSPSQTPASSAQRTFILGSALALPLAAAALLL